MEGLPSTQLCDCSKINKCVRLFVHKLLINILLQIYPATYDNNKQKQYKDCSLQQKLWFYTCLDMDVLCLVYTFSILFFCGQLSVLSHIKSVFFVCQGKYTEDRLHLFWEILVKVVSYWLRSGKLEELGKVWKCCLCLVLLSVLSN